MAKIHFNEASNNFDAHKDIIASWKTNQKKQIFYIFKTLQKFYIFSVQKNKEKIYFEVTY